ncbi:hypothetical protein [Kaistia terrae]|uniref:Uncharacterized protein n=1 Tax=Kaistia terrae TaxID=537017 RepID=A0ABW0Q1V4_9HYPH|nr:hypothetical protein [Kaistia terrae]MCX5579711.1 hypothetical protein [Kaistia terrae]
MMYQISRTVQERQIKQALGVAIAANGRREEIGQRNIGRPAIAGHAVSAEWLECAGDCRRHAQRIGLVKIAPLPVSLFYGPD